jgi:hypothetical protein
MFARSVSIHLRPNSVAEFTQTIETEILPLLRKQKGFEDELTFVVREEEAVATSLWDRKENADVYSRVGIKRAEVSREMIGEPTVRTYEVSNSTFHKIAAAVAA